MPPHDVEIVIDEEQLRRTAEAVASIPMGLPKVLSRAVNKVAVAARTRLLRLVAGQINVRQKDLRDKNVKLTKANVRRLLAGIAIRGTRIALLAFGARQTRKGATYSIRKGQRKIVSSGFLESHGTPVRMRSGHRGVFVRSGTPRISRVLAPKSRGVRGIKKGMGWLARPRLPIRELKGPSVPEVVATTP